MLVLLDQFWDIWHSEYIAALRERHQSRIRQGNFSATCPKVGDIVIVADEKLPRVLYREAFPPFTRQQLEYVAAETPTECDYPRAEGFMDDEGKHINIKKPAHSGVP
nr:unnamed protein product [Haemonchus contortus]